MATMLPAFVKHDAARAGGALVKGEQVGHGGVLNWRIMAVDRIYSKIAMPTHATLYPQPLATTRRRSLLQRLGRAAPYDIAIVGGGATGLGVALDAAARGLSVVLVESHDFAKGTSSRATKLVHGGVRYLAQGNIALVREALA